VEDAQGEILFRQWVDEHMGIMWKVARAFAGDLGDQEDLLQDILLQVWRSTSTFDGLAQASTWIYRVAFNTAMAWKRKAKAYRLTGRLLVGELEVPDPGRQVQQAMEHREALERLYAAIRQLPKLDRSLVVLYLDGGSYQQISEVAGISVNNVGVRLTRARARLAQIMGVSGHGR
jgi:RNA polymerase sigma-70 factor (ECF subfamily)